MSEATTPLSSYVLCATPRTGSYLLCEGLRNTGIAGNPTEYLSGPYERFWSSRWEIRNYTEYMARITKLGSTPNGVFGVKMHPVQFNWFATRASGKAEVSQEERHELIERWFPGARYVWLRRRDKLAQGISYAKALQSRVWWDAKKAPAPYDAPRPDAVHFDRTFLERCVTQMHVEDYTWQEYFEVNGVQPLVIEYETMVQDLVATLRGVVEHLDLALPKDFLLAESEYRRQADSTTSEWRQGLVDAFVADPAIRMVDPLPPLARASAGPSTKVKSSATSDVEVPTSPIGLDLEKVLANRQWWHSTRPFPYVRAENVFRPTAYQAMVKQFREWHGQGRMVRDLPGYDASEAPLDKENIGAFSVFGSRAWHDVWARLFGVQATGELNITLHHHAKGSLSGSPHNDLNPGFFLEGDRNEDGIVIHDPKRCSYRNGKAEAGLEVVQRVRAVAILFYLANADGYGVGWGGETGFYRLASDPVDRPDAGIPAINNSLVAFECTPHSYHSFITNPYAERNCLVMWLHRPREYAVERWGAGSIVEW